MDKESTLLIKALCHGMGGAAFCIPDDVDWGRLLRLARAHNVEGLMYAGLRSHTLPTEIKTYLSNATGQAIFQDAQQSHIRGKLEQMLQDAGVPYIFLKGSVLKENYPVPALRTMSDLDVLVRSEDYAALNRIATALGGKSSSGDGNHKNYLFPGGVKVEFHPNLLHHATPVAAGINPGWQYATEENGRFRLTEEGFYLSILCHMAEHFVDGGIGVRFVLDIWIFQNLRNVPIDRSFVEKELSRFGLLDFAQNIEQLSRVWFDGERTTEHMEELGEYILTSGSHGTYGRQLLNAMTMSSGKNRLGVLWHKAFYPRQELEDRYPWAKKRPWLLPAAWCVRAFHAVTKHGRHIRAWSRDTGGISREDIQKQEEKLKRFGIHNRKK